MYLTETQRGQTFDSFPCSDFNANVRKHVGTEKEYGDVHDYGAVEKGKLVLVLTSGARVR